jgi:NAD(P)-dependent dehydrogenase (short-subunit alcohol dehydrogenase family)
MTSTSVAGRTIRRWRTPSPRPRTCCSPWPPPRHWSEDGIEVNALHPGAIADSNLARYYDQAQLDALRSSGRYTYKTLAQGAATSVYVATSPRLDGVAGRYFENCQEATPDDPTAAGTDAAGVAAYALDPEAAERLWAVSGQMNQ